MDIHPGITIIGLGQLRNEGKQATRCVVRAQVHSRVEGGPLPEMPSGCPVAKLETVEALSESECHGIESVVWCPRRDSSQGGL